MKIRRVCLVLISAVAMLAAPSVPASPVPELAPTLGGCDQPPPEARMWPDSGDPVSWMNFARRDFQNQGCAVQRWEDQSRHDELQSMYLQQTPPAYRSDLEEQLSDPVRPRLSSARLVPGVKLADPYRAVDRWQQLSGGSAVPVSFIASRSGAKLRGDIFMPAANVAGPYPGVIFATGGSQQFRQLYYWFAQGLAEEGYMVMMFDFQGQGDSESASHETSGTPCSSQSCLTRSVPGDLVYDINMYYDQMRDAIRFFFSTPSLPYGSMSSPNHVGSDLHNPRHAQLDTAKVGVAGHSIGSIVSNDIGQQDQRIKAIVRLGHFGYISPDYDDVAHAPSLIVNDEYGSKGPQPWFTLPSPTAWDHGFNQLVSKQLPAMIVHLRSSTHYEWTYSPARYASRYGERVSFYYVLAWYDTFLKGLTDDLKKEDGYRRLTAATFDASSDVHSIGAGTYEPDGNGSYRNVPYKIAGKRARDRISYFLRSRYWLRGGGLACEDMRNAGCLI